MSRQAFPLLHKQYVASLYRRSLKTSLNWYVDRALWRPVALKIRARFEANRNVTSTQELRKILLAAEKELEENYHPDPYKCEIFNWFYFKKKKQGLILLTIIFFKNRPNCTRRYKVGKKYSSAIIWEESRPSLT
jgi:hypothetical protein